MKKYKTWEAFKILEEKPKSKFVCKGEENQCQVTLMINSSGFVSVKGENCPNTFAGNISVFDKWELVQEPVDFIEAVKAYNEGKTILCKAVYHLDVVEFTYKATSKTGYAGDGYALKTVDGLPITTMEILKGQWYIQEDEE